MTNEITSIIKSMPLSSVVVVGLLVLMGIGIVWLALWTDNVQNKAYVELNNMSCGELKDFITYEKWKEYPARSSNIEYKATHLYEWTCEK